MTQNNAQNVSTGKPKATGAVFVAPAGTALPTDAVAPLATAYTCLGYISEDGLTNSVDTNIEEIKAWGGDIVYKTQTSFSETFGFACLETNIKVLKERYGADNVTETGTAISIKHTSDELQAHPWVFEIVLNAGRVKRVVIPNGKVTDLGDIEHTDGDAIKYDFTVAALPGTDGATAHTYIATPVV